MFARSSVSQCCSCFVMRRICASCSSSLACTLASTLIAVSPEPEVRPVDGGSPCCVVLSRVVIDCIDVRAPLEVAIEGRLSIPCERIVLCCKELPGREPSPCVGGSGKGMFGGGVGENACLYVLVLPIRLITDECLGGKGGEFGRDGIC